MDIAHSLHDHAMVRALTSCPVLAGRDLKAENVLHHSNGTWVLCDYGSTSAWSGHHEGSNDILVAEEDIRKHTTPAYRPPEVTLNPRS